MSTLGVLKILLLSVFAALVCITFVAYAIYKPPGFVIRCLQKMYPDVLFQVEISPSRRIVALTLDDAPSDETGKMLDLLKENNVNATFFVIGNQIKGREDILMRMHAEGHEIGNHAWADEPSSKLDLVELERQILQVENLIPTNVNQQKYFRPGSGFFNLPMVEKVKGLGYKVVLGSIYPHDPQIHSPKVNARHVLSMVRPGGIIIMHDRRSYSVEQLRLVLKGLSGERWSVLSLGSLMEISRNSKQSVNATVQ